MFLPCNKKNKKGKIYNDKFNQRYSKKSNYTGTKKRGLASLINIRLH